MSKGSSYLGTELYVTAYNAEKPTAEDKISYWRSMTNLFSFSKEEIELEFVDGNGYSDWTTGKRNQEDTEVDVHKIDMEGIKKLDEFALADPSSERCKIWAKPAPLIGDDTSEGYVSEAIITRRKERDTNTSNGQGASYVFKKCGKPQTWDGTLG